MSSEHHQRGIVRSGIGKLEAINYLNRQSGLKVKLGDGSMKIKLILNCELVA